MNVIPPPQAPQVQVFVVGNATVPAGVTELDSIRQIVLWIGFRDQQSRNAIVSRGRVFKLF